jgi:hypothetical protein
VDANASHTFLNASSSLMQPIIFDCRFVAFKIPTKCPEFRKHMPIFRRGNNRISIPEGFSYVCKGSRDTAEWTLCPGMEVGQYYKVRCENDKLSWVKVDAPSLGGVAPRK